jgi:hypothetical protein
MRFLGLVSLCVILGCNRTTPLGPGVEIVPPACVNPAPLLGQYDGRAPGYIIDLKDGVDVIVETDRLATRYNFTPTHVYDAVLGGFSANLTPAAVAGLRCENTVNYIEFNQLSYLD